MSTTHTLSPIAAKTVEAIHRYPDSHRRYIHAVIAAEREAHHALNGYEDGNADVAELADRLRDILAILEAAGGAS